jgi:hypothetical protein
VFHRTIHRAFGVGTEESGSSLTQLSKTTALAAANSENREEAQKPNRDTMGLSFSLLYFVIPMLLSPEPTSWRFQPRPTAVLAESEDSDDHPGSSLDEEPQRDVKIDEAKNAIMKQVFDKDPRTVMYERQLLVRFEDQFFHWITASALGELHDERQIDVQKLLLAENTEIKFYISKGHRGWRLQARAIRDIVLRFFGAGFRIRAGTPRGDAL